MGRLGGLTFYLNYTWIFASVLALWWVALLWLPENFPAWSTSSYWLVAVTVLILYLACIIVHEVVHSALARTGPRSVNLFPFGAAVPFKMSGLNPMRIMLAALGAPAFNLLLGGVLLWIGGAIPGPTDILGWLEAILIPLGTLNVWVGLLNLIPGTPFDGGIALSAAHFSFTGDRESGLGLAQSLGKVATLVLRAPGAWLGLTSNLWLQALALVVVGWSAREAADVGQHRRALRSVFAQMKALDFMDPAAPGDGVSESASVADLVRAYPRFSPNIPLAVLDSEGNLAGVTTIIATEQLMQGTWPTTPVRAIMTPLSRMYPVSPETSLVDVLEVLHARITASTGDVSDSDRSIPEEDIALPVVEDNKLLGSIDPARLQSLEAAGRQFGVQETLGMDASAKPLGFLGSLGALLPAIMLLAAMAILGNIALHTDPVDLQGVSPDTEGPIVFSDFTPADSDIVGLGTQEISVQVEGASAVVSATIILDGEPLDTQLSGSSPLTQTVSATATNLTLGQHTLRINAVTEGGNRENSQWRFRVDLRVAVPESSATPAPSTPVANTGVPLQVDGYRPQLGGRVPAAAGELTLSANVQSAQPPRSAQFSLDGVNLDTSIEPVDGATSSNGVKLYKIVATAPQAQALDGLHIVRVEIVGEGGETHSSEWTFSAIRPDAQHAYFKETGFFVTQPFLGYWQANGGLGLFGYPISDLVQETDKATGEVYTAQYFERARFEQHASTGEEVI